MRIRLSPAARRVAEGIVVAMVVVLCSSTAVGQEGETVELTETQLDLNERGIEAIEQGEYERAIRLLEAALDIGGVNLIAANLGRAHQHLGNCEEAEQQYRRAVQAPALEEPSPQQVADTVETYRDELEENCPGYLEVDCEPPDLELYVEDEGPQSCREEPRELMPGNYQLRGEYEERSREAAVAVEAMETSRVELEVPVRGEPTDQESVSEIPRPPEPDSPGIDWGWIAAGAASVGGGIALDTIPAQAHNYEVNAINFVPPGLYAAAVGFGYLGIRGTWQ